MPSRIVIVSSDAHMSAPSYGCALTLDGINNNATYSPWLAYSQSKLANILFARELNRRDLKNTHVLFFFNYFFLNFIFYFFICPGTKQVCFEKYTCMYK